MCKMCVTLNFLLSPLYMPTLWLVWMYTSVIRVYISLILSVTIGEPEMEVTNSNLLMPDLLDTADLEALLNPIVLEPGWLESLASS